ncbi:FixH family protein [Bacillus sp. FJAT-28004]|uniref:FixH family protein n=1 Tax=Bacillus sp. FJAT-28004 TaxID=1679165 RepID=UPI0006B51BBC|nr:FixH family protein [Bacillus sp. FJAT-28004]
MKTEQKPNFNLIKFSLLLLVLAVVVGVVFTWLRKGDELSPPITEHRFDNGEATWSIDAYPAKVLHNNLFKIELTDLSGAPLLGAEMSVKLEMLDMVCGDYEFKMTEAAPGTYTGEGVPLMAGTWKATLTLKTGDHTYTINRMLRAVH